jgi:polar amino acid transport system substrate-binding protein
MRDLLESMRAVYHHDRSSMSCTDLRRVPLCLLASLLCFTVGISYATSAMAAEWKLVRVAVKSIPPFVYTGESAPDGFSIDVWNEIAKADGFETEFVVLQSVGEILDAVEQGKADAGIAAITINAEREARIDFSHPFYRSGLRIAVPTRNGPTWFAAVGRFFSTDLLAMCGTLVALTLIAAHLLWFIERGVNSDCFPRAYSAGVGEAVWWSVATIITGGCENKAPVSLFGRTVAVAWMLGSIALVALFTATLSSQMTAESVAGAIGGPDDLPGRFVATVRNTSAVAYLRERNAKVRECNDLTASLTDIDESRADAVVFDAPVLAHAVNEKWSRTVRLVGPLFEQQDYGIAVQESSVLREMVNQSLLEISENGVLAQLNEKWFGQKE